MGTQAIYHELLLVKDHGERGRQRGHIMRNFLKEGGGTPPSTMWIYCANHKIFHFNHIYFYDFILFFSLSYLVIYIYW